MTALSFTASSPTLWIQGGGFTADMNEKPTKAPVKNEAGNGLKNDRGTLAMARTNIVDSATAQFFISVMTTTFLIIGMKPSWDSATLYSVR